MKTNFTLLILCLFIFVGNAQKYEITSDNPHVEEFELGHEAHVTAVIKNIFSDTIEIMWETTQISGTDWEYYICDMNTCYAPFIKACPEDIPNEMLVDQEGDYIFTVNDGGVEGSAVYSFCFWVNGERETTESCVEIHFSNSPNAVSDLSIYEHVKVYPNPTTDYFSLSENHDVNSIDIYSVLGSKVKSFKVVPNGSYDVTDLQDGLYISHLINDQGKKVKSMALRVR